MNSLFGLIFGLCLSGSPKTVCIDIDLGQQNPNLEIVQVCSDVLVTNPGMDKAATITNGKKTVILYYQYSGNCNSSI